MSRAETFVLAVAMLLLAAGASVAQVIDLDAPEKEDELEIWRKASAAAVKTAEEAAGTDARLRLVEAVYRLPVNGQRDVYDLMLKNPQVDADLIKGLGKAVPVGARHLEDGTVRVSVVTTPAEVVQILRKAYEKVDWDKAEDDAVIAAVARLTKADTQILAEGEGALAGSLGEKKIPIRRAGLFKGEKAIALQVVRMVIGEHGDIGRVRDFALDFKEVPKKLALGLATSTIHSEEWKEDGTVEMRVELNVINVVELIRRAQPLYDQRRKWANWWFGSLIAAARDRIYHAQVKAGPADVVPENTPLAGELEAIDEALKAAVKN